MAADVRLRRTEDPRSDADLPLDVKLLSPRLDEGSFFLPVGTIRGNPRVSPRRRRIRGYPRPTLLPSADPYTFLPVPLMIPSPSRDSSK